MAMAPGIDWEAVSRALRRCFDDIDRAGLDSDVFGRERAALFKKLHRLREEFDPSRDDAA